MTLACDLGTEDAVRELPGVILMADHRHARLWPAVLSHSLRQFFETCFKNKTDAAGGGFRHKPYYRWAHWRKWCVTLAALGKAGGRR